MKILIILLATFYSDKFENKNTYSGVKFNQCNLTCATREFPIGAELLVTNILNGKSICVTVTDKCKKRKIIDLSKSAFSKIAILRRGVVKVNVQKI